ncbi:hypothetical protein IX51_08870 [uncultured archaeon]|nr:hypothetical protein IX51_08870 [uncultured archaeon]
MLIRKTAIIVGLQILAFAIFFSIWQYIYSANIVPHPLLSSPIDTVTHFASIIGTPSIYSQIIYSLGIVLSAFVSTVAAGAALGMIIGEVLYLRKVLEPYLVLANSIPRVMFVTLFSVLLGYGFSYEFFFGFISGMFPVLITTMYTVSNVDPNLVRLSRSLGASSLQLQLKLMLPNVFPSILSAARLSFNLTLGGVLIAEEWAGSSGVGDLAAHFANTIQPIKLYVVVSAVALISIAINLALLQLEKYLTRWNVAKE